MPGPLAEKRPNLRREIFEDCIKWWEDGSVKPQLTREVPFDAAALQKTLDEWATCNVGKVVVKVAA